MSARCQVSRRKWKLISLMPTSKESQAVRMQVLTKAHASSAGKRRQVHEVPALQCASAIQQLAWQRQQLGKHAHLIQLPCFHGRQHLSARRH